MTLFENVEWIDEKFANIYNAQNRTKSDNFMFCYYSASQEHKKINELMLKEMGSYIAIDGWLSDYDYSVMSARILRDMTWVAPMQITDVCVEFPSIEDAPESITLSKVNPHWVDHANLSPWRSDHKENNVTSLGVVHVHVKSLDGNFLVYDNWGTLAAMTVNKGIVETKFPISKLFKTKFVEYRHPEGPIYTEGYVRHFNENCFEVVMKKDSRIQLVYKGFFNHEAIIHITY